jgi:hypothetical protein
MSRGVLEHRFKGNIEWGAVNRDSPLSMAEMHVIFIAPISVMYRSTVFWIPSGLKLCGTSQGTLLRMPHLSRCFVTMPSDQPRLIVFLLKRMQRQTKLFHSIKGGEP